MIKFKKVPFEIFRDTVLSMDLGVIFPTDDGFLRHAFEMLDLPSRATVGSAGYDIRTPLGFTLNPGKSVIIPTGLMCQMPQDVVLMVYPRSGLGFKHGIRLANSTGIIDSDFCNSNSKGHILLKLCNGGGKSVLIRPNERVCQGIFMHYLTTDDDDTTGVRDGGFGSTGTT